MALSARAIQRATPDIDRRLSQGLVIAGGAVGVGATGAKMLGAPKEVQAALSLTGAGISVAANAANIAALSSALGISSAASSAAGAGAAMGGATGVTGAAAAGSAALGAVTIVGVAVAVAVTIASLLVHQGSWLTFAPRLHTTLITIRAALVALNQDLSEAASALQVIAAIQRYAERMSGLPAAHPSIAEIPGLVAQLYASPTNAVLLGQILPVPPGATGTAHEGGLKVEWAPIVELLRHQLSVVLQVVPPGAPPPEPGPPPPEPPRYPVGMGGWAAFIQAKMEGEALQHAWNDRAQLATAWTDMARVARTRRTDFAALAAREIQTPVVASSPVITGTVPIDRTQVMTEKGVTQFDLVDPESGQVIPAGTHLPAGTKIPAGMLSVAPSPSASLTASSGAAPLARPARMAGSLLGAKAGVVSGPSTLVWWLLIIAAAIGATVTAGHGNHAPPRRRRSRR